jgi:hypothetical protein
MPLRILNKYKYYISRDDKIKLNITNFPPGEGNLAFQDGNRFWALLSKISQYDLEGFFFQYKGKPKYFKGNAPILH